MTFAGTTLTCPPAGVFAGAVVKMEHFQPALDPRKQELLEMRFTGAKVGLGYTATPATTPATPQRRGRRGDVTPDRPGGMS